MGPQTILLAVYGLTQMAQVIMEELKIETGVTDEQLREMWKEQREDFLSAMAMWKLGK